MPKYVIETEEEAVIVPLKEYDMLREKIDDLIDTIEILSDPDLPREIEQAERELAEGKTISWEEVKRQMGWNED